MPLLGHAAVAMWWDLDPAARPEFEDWHAHEHFPERLGLPGFRRGSRWARNTGDGFFVLYELADYSVLTSPAYRERLDNPTPWSTRMMPQHRNMVRSQAHIVSSHGHGIGGHLITLRLAPRPGAEATLQQHLETALAALPAQRGCIGAHLLITDTPDAAPTREQRIRGQDQSAQWIILCNGYHLPSLSALVDSHYAEAELTRAGAEPGLLRTEHHLAYTLTATDLHPLNPQP